MTDEYNDGYTHETMHTAHVLLDTWDQHVAETRACDEFPDLKDAAHKAAAAMYFFYQLAGQKFHEAEPSPQENAEAELVRTEIARANEQDAEISASEVEFMNKLSSSPQANEDTP